MLGNDDIVSNKKSQRVRLAYALAVAANDDQVDAMTQALRQLYPLFNKLKISQAALDKAMGR